MIFYHPELAPRWQQYGILVPLVDNRSAQVFQSLRESGLPFLRETALPKPLTPEQITLAHDLDFVARLFEPSLCEGEIIRCFELEDSLGRPHRYAPSSATLELRELVQDISRQAAMSAQAMEQAVKSGGMTYFLGGGMHHAMSFSGRGFCLINDIVIGLRLLQKKGAIEHAWVIDVDAHRGDGTAQITFDDSSVTTLSIHMKQGWPLNEKDSDPAFYRPSDIDISVGQGEEDRYLELLSEALEQLEKNFPTPGLVVINQGADVYEKDELESTSLLNLTLEQVLRRDLLIEERLAKLELPRTYLMSGGYGEHSWRVYRQFLGALNLVG